MANTIYTPVTLDVGGKNNLKVWAKQYDSNDRWITATIVNGDTIVKVDPESVVTINARREDDAQNSFVGEVNTDGTVNLPITYWMTFVAGTVSCDVSFYLDGRLSSLTFKLKVEEAATDPSEVIPVEDRDIVTALINDCQDATSEAETATESANIAAQTATTAASNANAKAEEAENAATNANEKAVAAETATDNAYAAATAANTAAQRAEAAAEQLDVDLTEIRSDIADNTRDIGTLGNQVHILEDDVSDCEDDIDLLKGRLTTAESSIGSLSRNKEDVENKVYQTNAQKNMKYYSVAGTDNAINQAISNLKASNIPYDDDISIEEAMDELEYGIDTLNSTKQSKVFKTNEIRQNADNDHYPSELAVKTYVDSQGGGTSAMMVTFTITGIDGSGNYTGDADKTYTEMSNALTNGEVVRGQISVNGQNFISYSTSLGSSTIRFYLASLVSIIELVAEWAGDGDNEGNAQFTVYATGIISPSQMESEISTAISGTLDKGIVNKFTFPIPYGTPDTTAYNVQYPERGFLVNYNDYSTTGNVNITFHTATSGGTPQVYRCTRLVIPVQEGDTFVYTGMAGGQRTIPNYIFVGDAIGESADWYENISAGQVISFPFVSASSSSSSGSQIAYKQRTLSASSGFEYDGSTMLREFTKTETIGTKVSTALPIVDGNTLFVRASSSSFGTVGINHGVIVAPVGAKFLIVQGAFNRMYDNASVSGFYDTPVEMQPQIVQIDSGSKPAILNTTPDYYTWRGGADYFNALSNFNPFYKYEILS